MKVDFTIKMKRFILCLFFFFLLFNESVSALHPSVRNFTSKISQSGNQNWDIVQQSNNWMYFANNNGLLEFDGNRWNIYPISNFTNVRSIYYDKGSDRIYAGAFNEFGYYVRNKSGILIYHSLISMVKPADKSFNEIWHIHKLENTMYFQGDNEIFQYSDKKVKRFTFKNKLNFSAVVHDLLVVSGTKDGVSFLNGNMFFKLPGSDVLKNKKVCSILPFGGSSILFVTDFYGMYIFDGESVKAYKTNIDGFLSENQVFCATISGTKLALGTVRNGLAVRDLKDGTTFYVNTYSGLQNNTILSMSFDNQNNLWLGLDKGIDYVLINSPIFNLFGNSERLGSGYASLLRGSNLYLGTNQGLYVTNFPLKNSPEPLNVNLLNRMQGQVWSLVLIDNTIFCGTDHGAYIVEGTNAYQIPGVSGTWNFRELLMHPGYILGSSYQGFFILKKLGGKWVFSNFVKGFEDYGGMFEEDMDGNIWFSHWIKGIFRLTFNDKLDSFQRIENFDSLKGFPTTRNNTLYKIDNQIVFSTENGFFTYNHTLRKLVRAKKLESYFGRRQNSMRLFETKKGDIWCVSASYIGCASINKDKSFQVDSLSFAPLKSKLITGFVNFNFIDENKVVASTEDGFSWLDLSLLKKAKNGSDFKISIRNVYFTKDRDSAVIGYQAGQSKKYIPKFEYKHNSIRFEFAAPEFRNEGSVTYSYLLENYDDEWSTYSTVNTKEYTKLRKGTYNFRVKAKSQLESKTVETSFKFTILPPWYESSLAFIIYALILLFLVFRLLLYIKKRSEKGALEMKVQKELEMKAQEKRFMADSKEKEKEIIALKNQRLQHNLRHKSQELASSTMNLIRKNEILLDINQDLTKVAIDINAKNEKSLILKRISKMQQNIKVNIEHDNNWKRFEENFDMVYENYLERLGELYPALSVNDKKLCAYLKMGLCSKDIAPLLNISYRSVEMSRYRLRQKMDIDRNVNLTEYLQGL